MHLYPEPVTALPALSQPIYFVNKDPSRFADLISADGTVSNVAEVYSRCISGPDIWAVQSFLNLKLRQLDVRLTDRFIPGKICVAPYMYLSIKDLPFNSFVVCTRTDTAKPAICEMQTVMNHKAISGEAEYFMPHWPQPTLMPRDRSRGADIQNIDFKGHPRNLLGSFKKPEFRQRLAELGIKFLFDQDEATFDEKDVNQLLMWSDYSQSDILVAVRNLTSYDIDLKPALKLVNAWRAGVPALMGPESAYQELKKSELDYIEVRNADDVIAALKRLKSDPQLYLAMIENADQRAKEFSTDAVALAWWTFLAEQVIPAYEKWAAQGALAKSIGRPFKFFLRTLQHKKNLQEHVHQRDHGFRPIVD